MARCCLPPERRLKRPIEFQQVFAKSMRSSDEFFTILAHDGSRGYARLGLAISKRAAKRAVARNRLKRLVRETFRTRKDLPGCDFVVLAKPLAENRPNAVLQRSLERHFRIIAKKQRSN